MGLGSFVNTFYFNKMELFIEILARGLTCTGIRSTSESAPKTQHLAIISPRLIKAKITKL